MTKRFLWLLATAPFLSPAFAQSHLTIYGIADAGLQISRFGGGTQYALASGMADGSRLGFKGSEDLGGGYKAIFNLEMRVELDRGTNSNGYISDGVGQALVAGITNPGLRAALISSLQPAEIINPDRALFDRTSMVGLITPVGAVLLGRQYTPDYEILAGADTFETGTVGGWGQIIGGTGGFLTTGVAIRANQAIQYRLQLPNGVGGALMYGFNNTGSLNQASRFRGANIKYIANGLNVGVGYNDEDDQLGRRSLHSFTVGGSYSFGDYKVFAGFHRMKNDNSVLIPILSSQLTPVVGAAAANTIAGVVGNNAKLDARSYMLGAHYRLGAGRIMGSIARTDDDRPTNARVTVYALGYDHNLSKRTDIYTVFAHAANRNAQYALGGAGYLGGFTSEPGRSANALQLGIRHKF